MFLQRIAFAALLTLPVSIGAGAETTQETSPQLYLELNAVQNVQGACRLTFLARNDTASPIEQAVFETVVFDGSGGVVSLSLFDFRELPLNRPRVRQFDLPGMSCENIGQALINGASTCTVDGGASTICQDALKLNSRLSVELSG